MQKTILGIEIRNDMPHLFMRMHTDQYNPLIPFIRYRMISQAIILQCSAAAHYLKCTSYFTATLPVASHGSFSALAQ